MVEKTLVISPAPAKLRCAPRSADRCADREAILVVVDAILAGGDLVEDGKTEPDIHNSPASVDQSGANEASAAVS